MADYQLSATDDMVLRTVDQVWIPNDPANRDWVEYQEWLEGGGVPDPYVEPEPMPPQPTTEQQIAYDHENRIRALEGQAPLTIGDLLGKLSP